MINEMLLKGSRFLLDMLDEDKAHKHIDKCARGYVKCVAVLEITKEKLDYLQEVRNTGKVSNKSISDAIDSGLDLIRANEHLKDVFDTTIDQASTTKYKDYTISRMEYWRNHLDEIFKELNYK